LLATIMSRCQPVRFRRLSEKERPRALTHDQIEAVREAERLWEKLPAMSPAEVLAESEPRSRKAASGRAEVEEQLAHLLMPALRDLRAGTAGSDKKVQLIQKAQQQLRQNVPPALVYDHLLLRLSRTR
jgi:hypothetical protein